MDTQNTQNTATATAAERISIVKEAKRAAHLTKIGMEYLNTQEEIDNAVRMVNTFRRIIRRHS
jgi:hypothetical protein